MLSQKAAFLQEWRDRCAAMPAPRPRTRIRELFHLEDRGTGAYLNHGAFGACPKAITALRCWIEEEAEKNLMRFHRDVLPTAAAECRVAARRFLGYSDVADVGGPELAFVRNATAGLFAVMRSGVQWRPGDAMVVSSFAYHSVYEEACVAMAKDFGVRCYVAEIPYPVTSPTDVVEAYRGAVRRADADGRPVRLAVVELISSKPSIIFPWEEVGRALRTARSAEDAILILDGAHVR